MSDKFRILVVGAGSVGGYFGGRLAAAGRDVTFLVRPARAKELEARGIEIVSPYGDLTLQPKLVTAGLIDGNYDVIILGVKAFALDRAIADLSPAVGPKTMILPVLNGMRHMDVLKTRFGPTSVLGCVCRVATTLDAEGRIVQLNPLQQFSYGELDGSISERIGLLDRAIQGGGFETWISSTILRDMWEKWVQLATLGAATCLLRGNVGEIVAAPSGRETALALMKEVVSIVRVVGVAASDAFLATLTRQLTSEGSPLTSSMYRDLRDGRPVEADQILGDLLQRGMNAGLSSPLIASAYAQLKVYAARLEGRGEPRVG